jgi:hypothetical protein
VFASSHVAFIALYLETQAPACHRRRTLSFFGVRHVKVFLTCTKSQSLRVVRPYENIEKRRVHWATPRTGVSDLIIKYPFVLSLSKMPLNYAPLVAYKADAALVSVRHS